MARDLGDFQTPIPLAEEILKSLSSQGKIWTRAIEPTCGKGNFVGSLLEQATTFTEIHGIEIQDKYVRQALRLVNYSPLTKVVIRQANLFDVNLTEELQWNTTGPLLVIGNPPWVTNSELGSLGSTNLPGKVNLKGLRGIDARTGSSNFDIAEYIWLKLMKELASEKPTIAMLCKTSVARNVLHYAYKESLPIAHASIRKIDAKKWFGAAVDACLFQIEVGSEECRYEAAVYKDLNATKPDSVISISNGHLVADSLAHNQNFSMRSGESSIIWRQGLKHDAASVMELTYNAENALQNKLGEDVIVEPDSVYPLLKGSDLFHYTENRTKRAVIVTQKKIGEDTRHLEQTAPQLWIYLTRHRQAFENRKSSIYNGQPPFAIFGIGDYSFAPYKVAISGLHKIPRFRAIGPVDDRPVMLDDTCYFIPCTNAKQAAILASLLNDPACLDYIKSIFFVDAKRPITKKLLQRIDLASLFNLIEKQSLMTNVQIELERMEAIAEFQELEKLVVEDFLFEYKSIATSLDAQQSRVQIQELPFSWLTVS
ncbi:MAG: hypothetical protein JO011_16995 [Ktedonobacteraceae bacterium]|nr:hypothetical protein [Ktedonobacteraceae bacterium]MBV9712602.1 hypothetical protein [Ktedonobacteraceae bacterium]